MELQVRRHSTGSLDRHRNPVDVWADPVPWTVRGMAPGAATEPALPNRDPAIVEWTVYADLTDDLPGTRDRVLVGGAEFEVVSTPADWTRSPVPNPVAGAVVELKRWEG